MIKSILKDKKYREEYLRNEEGLFLMKNYVGNLYLHKSVRNKLYNYTGYLKNTRVYVNNYCIITGRSKGVVKDFQVSSLELKRLVMLGKAVGVERKSW